MKKLKFEYISLLFTCYANVNIANLSTSDIYNCTIYKRLKYFLGYWPAQQAIKM